MFVSDVHAMQVLVRAYSVSGSVMDCTVSRIVRTYSSRYSSLRHSVPDDLEKLHFGLTKIFMQKNGVREPLPQKKYSN